MVKTTAMNEVIELMRSIHHAQTFVHQNGLYKGDAVNTAKQYVKENPSKKFRTWLHDKGLLIQEPFDPEFIGRRMYETITPM